MDKTFEIRVAIDKEGIRYIQIAGSQSAHKNGHDTYFAIQDILKNLDVQIRERFREFKSGENTENH